jgi:hypothetical protein
MPRRGEARQGIKKIWVGVWSVARRDILEEAGHHALWREGSHQCLAALALHRIE